MGYTNADVKEIKLVDWGKPKPDGEQEQRYKAFFHDGKEKWLRRVTSILNYAGGATELFKQWSVDRTCDFFTKEWQPDTPYSAEHVEKKLAEGRWYHKERFTETGDWGTMAHDTIECFLKTDYWPTEAEIREMPAPVQNSLAVFSEWWSTAELNKVVAVEKLVYDLELNYGGKLDFLAKDKQGRLIVLDWKTSGGIYAKFKLQLAAYVGGLAQSTGEVCHAAAIVRFGKTDLLPQMQWVSKDELRQAYYAFKRTCHLAAFLSTESGRQQKLNDEHKAKEAEARRQREEEDKPGISPVTDPKDFWKRVMDLVRRTDIRLHAVMADCRIAMVESPLLVTENTIVHLYLEPDYVWHRGKAVEGLAAINQAARQAAKIPIVVVVDPVPDDAPGPDGSAA